MVEFINYSKQKVVSSLFLRRWVQAVFKELKKRKIKTSKLNKGLILVFLTPQEMKKLNFKFRKKNKVTDVLSFLNQRDVKKHDPPFLGEIVLCPVYIKKQSRKNRIRLREYWAYMILHGILHLLGFEHEDSPEKARKMFLLQDQIFEKLKPLLKN